jgi:hypothetical protein
MISKNFKYNCEIKEIIIIIANNTPVCNNIPKTAANPTAVHRIIPSYLRHVFALRQLVYVYWQDWRALKRSQQTEMWYIILRLRVTKKSEAISESRNTYSTCDIDVRCSTGNFIPMTNRPILIVNLKTNASLVQLATYFSLIFYVLIWYNNLEINIFEYKFKIIY